MAALNVVLLRTKASLRAQSYGLLRGCLVTVPSGFAYPPGIALQPGPSEAGLAPQLGFTGAGGVCLSQAAPDLAGTASAGLTRPSWYCAKYALPGQAGLVLLAQFFSLWLSLRLHVDGCHFGGIFTVFAL